MANFINIMFGRIVSMEKTFQNLEESYNNFKAKYANFYEWQSYDGNGNNLYNPNFGKANTALLRQSSSDYENGSTSLAIRGASNPNPRIVSNLLCKTDISIPNSQNLTDMMWIWGQFIDHLLDLTRSQTSGETANMITPSVMEDPNEDYPGRTILFDRSIFIINTDPREQPNNISSFMDASNVYGSDSDRAYALRRLDGTGKLLTTTADNGEILMPYNINELENAAPTGSTPSDFFLAGDIRSNENIFLTAIHTLFVREHNRLCDIIVSENTNYIGKDELIYQTARKLVIGMIQYITYEQFLPNLLGSFPKYNGYNKNTNVSIKTEFSAVAYRLGHSMLSSSLKTGENTTILLRDAFFSPTFIQTNGIDNLLLGGSLGIMQEIDTRIVEDVRSFLFGPPSAMNLLDLPALNMQRARDHGIPGYNILRQSYGLSSYNNFTDITNNTTISSGLESLYDSVDDIDPWIGGLAEDHISGSNLGELFSTIIKTQFMNVRDGDRFYYKNDTRLSQKNIDLIENSTLDKIIERNCNLTNLGNVFKN
jgi:hypothetical protein